MRRRRVLVVGHGAIGRAVLARLPEHAPEAILAGLLVRPARVAETARDVASRIEVVGTLADALALRPDIVVECAGHQAVRDYGLAVLSAGADLVVASVGALAEAALLQKLTAAASGSGAQLVIPSGAIGGMDALAAARVGGLTRVAYTSRKPPKAWKGTPAEQVTDLDGVCSAVTLYEGAADAAARTYAQNANVAATVALAGRGMAATEVRLIADPAESGNVHVIDAEGAFGTATIILRGKPMAENPKTSSLTAMSLVHAVAQRTGALALG